MNASVTDYTDSTPYTTIPPKSKLINLHLIDTLKSCQNVVLKLVPGNYNSIVWNNNINTDSITASSSGTYTVKVETEKCKFYFDTIVVILGEPIPVATFDTICDNDSILFHGAYYKNTGVYRDTTESKVSCDTVNILHLSTRPNPIVNLGKDTSICTGQNITLNANITGASYLWNNNQTSSSIVASVHGLYWLRVEVNKCFGRDTILLSPSDYIYKNIPYDMCETDSLNIAGEFIKEEGNYYDTINSSTSCDTILNYQVSIINSVSEKITLEACPGQTINYLGKDLIIGSMDSFVLTNFLGCDSIVHVSVNERNASYDTLRITTCINAPVYFNNDTLFAGNKYYYSLKTKQGCDSFLTIYVDEGKVDNRFLGKDIIECSPSVRLISPNANSIWNTGATSGYIDVTKSGMYIASFVDIDGCINTDTINVSLINNKIFIPNAFTPGDDLLNNCFKPKFSPEVQFNQYEFEIYDRWGELIYHTLNSNDCWGGTFMNTPVQAGVYLWALSYTILDCNERIYKFGDVTLIR